MFRTAICLLIAVIIAILIIPVIIILKIISLIKPGTEFPGTIGCFCRIFIPFLLKLAGVKFEITGKENLPEGRGYMFVGNHQSGFDAVVPLLYLGKTMSVVLKKEIAKIPFAGWALKLFGCIFLDRSNLRAQVACIHEMETRLRAGRDIAIFPEGTRSKGPDMGEFKAGAFKAAISAGTQIVPFVIDGSWHCYEEQGRLMPHTVQLSILPPVSTGGLTSKDAKDMASRVREMMQQEQFRLRAEKGNINA